MAIYWSYLLHSSEICFQRLSPNKGSFFLIVNLTWGIIAGNGIKYFSKGEGYDEKMLFGKEYTQIWVYQDS